MPVETQRDKSNQALMRFQEIFGRSEISTTTTQCMQRWRYNKILL